jgi:RHS repeat-associated protein
MQGQVATRNHRAAEPTPHRAYQDHARYDNNGNMTQMPQLTMSYDVANRMTTSNHASAGTQLYGYNHANQRVFVRNGNTVTYYLYGLGGERLMEFQETCTSGACTSYTETQRWIYFAGRKMFSKTGTTLKAITPNRLASEAKHFPYGETDGTPPSDTKDYFATYRRDGTGLDYAWNRYYSPTMGRFTTADPYGGSVRLSNPGTWNRYAYANSNPVLNRDPSGLDVEDPCGSSPHVCNVFDTTPLLGTISIWDILTGTQGNLADLVPNIPPTHGAVMLDGRWVDNPTTASSRYLANAALNGLKNTPCANVFQSKLGVSIETLSAMNQRTVYYDTTNSFFGSLQTYEVTFDIRETYHETKLSDYGRWGAYATAKSHVGANDVVLLHANYFSDSDNMGATLVHELIHLAIGNMGDSTKGSDGWIIDKLGIGNRRSANYGGSGVITQFIANECSSKLGDRTSGGDR